MAKREKVQVTSGASGQAPARADVSAPPVDVYDAGKELVLVAELPGCRKEDISVQVDKGVLTLEAEGKFDVPGEDFGRTYVSFEPGRYFRAFALSDEIDREKISATVSDGVLKVHLPKAAGSQSRRIEIKVSR